MAYPLISIVLPCYNGAVYLESALRSCLTQTYPEIEIIFVDDCSTDNSFQIAERLQQEFPRRKLRLLRNEVNIGLPGTLNVGHRAAKGQYLTWTSDDNLMLPEAIEMLYRHLVEKAVDVVYADYLNINQQGKPINRMKLQAIASAIFFNPIGACFLYKREVFEALDGYNEALFRLEDYDFWLRASVQFTFGHLSKVLYHYRQHAGSLTHDMQTNPARTKEIETKAWTLYADFFTGLGLSFSTKEIDLHAQLFLNEKNPAYDWRELDAYLSKWQTINQTKRLFDLVPFEYELLQQLIRLLNKEVRSFIEIFRLLKGAKLWSGSKLRLLDKWWLLTRSLYNLRAAAKVDYYLHKLTNTFASSGAP